MSDPCYKDIVCPYYGLKNSVAMAWAEDERCHHCQKWLIHKENNLLENELENLEKEYRIRRQKIYKKYESKS